MSRVDWMEEVLVYVSPSDKDTLSTYFHIEVLGVEILKLLTIIKHNTGPSFVPWGTPRKQKQLGCNASSRELDIHEISLLQKAGNLPSHRKRSR